MLLALYPSTAAQSIAVAVILLQPSIHMLLAQYPSTAAQFIAVAV